MTLYPIDIIYIESFENTMINYGEREADDIVLNMNWQYDNITADVNEPYNRHYFHIVVLF